MQINRAGRLFRRDTQFSRENKTEQVRQLGALLRDIELAVLGVVGVEIAALQRQDGECRGLPRVDGEDLRISSPRRVPIEDAARTRQPLRSLYSLATFRSATRLRTPGSIVR
jgi:hypothetical protein